MFSGLGKLVCGHVNFNNQVIQFATIINFKKLRKVTIDFNSKYYKTRQINPRKRNESDLDKHRRQKNIKNISKSNGKRDFLYLKNSHDYNTYDIQDKFTKNQINEEVFTNQKRAMQNTNHNTMVLIFNR